jgi:hypothetical protein
MKMKEEVKEEPAVKEEPVNEDPLETISELDILGDGILEGIFAKFAPEDAKYVPALQRICQGRLKGVIKRFLDQHKLDSSALRGVVEEKQHTELEKLLKVKLEEAVAETLEGRAGQDDNQEEECAEPAKKKRRGKKRCRPSANERRWNQLDQAGRP